LHAFPKDEDKDEDPGPNRYGKTDIIVAVWVEEASGALHVWTL